MNDHFLLRGTFGAPYEFLWANPYQPGLSYFQAPLVDARQPFRALVRTVQLGGIRRLAGLLLGRDCKCSMMAPWRSLDPHADAEPLDLGPRRDSVRRAHAEIQSLGRKAKQPVFVVGLKPHQNYLIEVDDEEVSEEETDPAGILPLDVPHGREVGVRIRGADDRFSSSAAR